MERVKQLEARGIEQSKALEEARMEVASGNALRKVMESSLEGLKAQLRNR